MSGGLGGNGGDGGIGGDAGNVKILFAVPDSSNYGKEQLNKFVELISNPGDGGEGGDPGRGGPAGDRNGAGGGDPRRGENGSIGRSGKVGGSKASIIDVISENAFCGIQIPTKLIPKGYINKYRIDNLWKYNISKSWRLLYSVARDEGVIIAIILDWFPHKEYEKRFNY